MLRPSSRRHCDEEAGARVAAVPDGPARERRVGHHIGQPAPDGPAGEEQDRRAGDGPRGALAPPLGSLNARRSPRWKPRMPRASLAGLELPQTRGQPRLSLRLEEVREGRELAGRDVTTVSYTHLTL